LLGIKIVRDASATLHRFTDYFIGFENVPAIRKLFGTETEKVLHDLKVEFYSSRFGYMSVCQDDGHILVSTYYLKHGDERSIYLDVIHELTHIKQFMNGEELFDDRFEYVDRPTEIEAYKYAIEEGRRIGMNDGELYEYLKMDWMSQEEVDKLAKALGIRNPKPDT
jgi:hypothetical protein